MDKESLTFLKGMEDKNVARLFRGIYNKLESKFPSQNYPTGAMINRAGFHMKHKDVDYNINFVPNDNMKFKMLVDVPESLRDNLEEKINEHSKSNAMIEQTKYLSRHKLQCEVDSLNSSCYLKTIPKKEKDVNKLCDQLWGYVIKPVFLGIYD